MQGPSSVLRAYGADEHAPCGKCGAHMPFEYDSCPTCTATVAADGTRLDATEVVDTASFCNELDVNDFRKSANNTVTFWPQHQEAIDSLPTNS